MCAQSLTKLHVPIFARVFPIDTRVVITDPVTGERTGFTHITLGAGTKAQWANLLRQQSAAKKIQRGIRNGVSDSPHDSRSEELGERAKAAKTKANEQAKLAARFSQSALLVSVRTAAPQLVQRTASAQVQCADGFYIKYELPRGDSESGGPSFLWWDAEPGLSSKAQHIFNHTTIRPDLADVEFQILGYNSMNVEQAPSVVLGRFVVPWKAFYTAICTRQYSCTIRANMHWERTVMAQGPNEFLPGSLELHFSFQSLPSPEAPPSLCPGNSAVNIRVHGVDLDWTSVMEAWDRIVGSKKTPAGAFLRFHFWDCTGESQVGDHNEWTCHRTKVLSLQGLVESGFEVIIPIVLDVDFIQYINSEDSLLRFDLCMVEDTPSSDVEPEPFFIGSSLFDLAALLSLEAGIKRVEPIIAAIDGESSSSINVGQIEAEVALRRERAPSAVALYDQELHVRPVRPKLAVLDANSRPIRPSVNVAEHPMAKPQSSQDVVEKLQAAIEEEWLKDDGEFGKILQKWNEDDDEGDKTHVAKSVSFADFDDDDEDASAGNHHGAQRDIPSAVKSDTDVADETPNSALNEVAHDEQPHEEGRDTYSQPLPTPNVEAETSGTIPTNHHVVIDHCELVFSHERVPPPGAGFFLTHGWRGAGSGDASSIESAVLSEDLLVVGRGTMGQSPSVSFTTDGLVRCVTQPQLQ